MLAPLAQLLQSPPRGTSRDLAETRDAA
jgi:hypothetical protein